MKISQIEELLLQEMEDIKGGVVGTCQCSKGAGQAGEPGGTCICTDGAGQLLLDKEIVDNPPVCVCQGGAGM